MLVKENGLCTHSEVCTFVRIRLKLTMSSRRTVLLGPSEANATKVTYCVFPHPGNGKPKYYAFINAKLYMLRGF